MDEEFTTPTYPLLEPPVEAPLASAPIDTKVVEMQSRHISQCSVCSGHLQAPGDVAYGVMRCGHHSHLLCLLKFASVGAKRLTLSADMIGGTAHCTHCRENVLQTGMCSEYTNPETTVDACLQRLREKHEHTYSINAVAVARNQLTPDQINEMLGVKKGGGGGAGVMLSLFSAAQVAAARGWSANHDNEPEESAEQAETRRWREMPTGGDFIDAMKASGRTIYDVFQTLKYALPHIYSAGVQTIDGLAQIGFDPETLLERGAYGSVAPVFFLVSHYGLSYNEHMQHMSVAQLAALGLNAREMLVLGIDAPLLMQKAMKKHELLAFPVAPSNWVKFLALQPSHLVVLGFQRKSQFYAVPRWGKNIKINSKAKQLMDTTLMLQGK